MRILLVLFLLSCSATAFCSRVDTLIIYSESMSKNIKNVVILPDSYSPNKSPLPVLYALHGANGDYRFWPKYIPEIKILADKYNIIIICPDGGNTSWYFDSPVDSTYKYETYITKELVVQVDKEYNTIANSKSRAIMGLSMGGHGAFYLAFRHPGLWGVAISTSGGLYLEPYPYSWDIAKRLGPLHENPASWHNNSVMNLTHLIDRKNLKIFFDCGTEDFFYNENKKFHEKLLAMKIPHNYLEMPGGHTLEYWKKSIYYHFVFLDAHLVR